MATVAQVHVEEQLDPAPGGSRLWWIHAVAAVIVFAIAIVAIAIDAGSSALFAAVVAGVFTAFSAGFWYAERQR